MYIVDRRLNPGGKSLENRQRFLRRAKALVQGAVKKSSEGRDIRDVLEGGEVSIPLDGMNEPRFRREGGTRDMVLPGNKKFVEGDMLPRSGEGRGRATAPGEGDSEDAFRFVLSRDEFVDLFLDDLELPDLAKRKLAEAEQRGASAGRLRDLRLAREYLGQPYRAACAGAAGRVAATAAGDDRAARGRARRLRRGAPQRVAGRDRSIEGKSSPDSVHRSDRHPIPPLRNRAEAGGPGRHVLSDGRVRLNVRAYEGPRQAVLHAALRVSDAALSPRRDRLHSSYRPGGRGRRRYFLSRAGVGRHPGIERAAGDGRDRQVAVSSGGLEHLRRPGLRRR